jgi:hypothetical protein
MNRKRLPKIASILPPIARRQNTSAIDPNPPTTQYQNMSVVDPIMSFPESPARTATWLAAHGALPESAAAATSKGKMPENQPEVGAESMWTSTERPNGESSGNIEVVNSGL